MSDQKTILIVGGAGYVGSHAAKLLSKQGYRPLVLDDLSTGHKTAVKSWPLIEGSYGDLQLVEKVLKENSIQTVMHFGAKALVGESVKDPLLYYAANVGDTTSLLRAMLNAGAKYFIFSSTCATFGEPSEPIHENLPQNPVNPYGLSKLFVERILRDVTKAYDFHAVVLRYFNAAGADPEAELGEDHRPETHLIPKILRVVEGLDSSLQVHGNDYPTNDGTCIRDYVHVNDLADAHIRAMKHLWKKGGYFDFNLGSEHGSSVLEVISSVEKMTGKKVRFEFGPRRPGDPPKLVANSQRAHEVLEWKTKFSLDEIVRTAYGFLKKHPKGFLT